MTDAAAHEIDAALRRRLRQRLLRWYRAERRDLPWRRERPDPYHVLVSEAMLQQTQVTTVVDYFERFVARWPTVGDLAAADEQDVLAQWQGLGYYRRARNLHAAARQIVERFDGVVPSTVEGLLTLPGVGRYTAGAIASIAFDRPAAILDGNVARVLARWFAIEQPIDDTSVQRRLWALAEQLVRGGSPGDLNQALMELGSLVCTPKAPRCLTCPVAALCEARERGMAESLPARRAKRAPKPLTHHVVAVRRGDGRWLFERRPERGLWSMMWQLPTAEALDADDNEQDAAGAALQAWLARRTGLAIESPRRVDSFVHQTTHRTITFVLWEARPHSADGSREASSRTTDGHPTAWRSLDDLADLPLANPQRRMVRTLGGLAR